MVPRAGLEPARIAPHAPQTCAATNYATSAVELSRTYLFAGTSVFAGGGTFSPGTVFELASTGRAEFALVSVGVAVLAFASTVFEFVEAGVSPSVWSTETLPVKAGIARNNADIINVAAATIVIFDKTVAVPRGLNAELDTLLVNNAPASVLPGCSKTDATSTMHERKNIPYKK